MQTIEEIRREWLLELINQHKTIAGLNVALGRARTDATLSQIKNQAMDSKSGNPRNMGSPLAREIEEKLGLEIGALDHPITDVASQPWNDYQAADEAIRHIVDFILSKDTSTPPYWADRETRAYLEAIELRVRKWIEKGKSSDHPKKARA